ncbi:agmatine deiminase [Frondihabitans sp. PhB188]|uniref:agmatine deiminase family protein n=1 Tax=Frondihabitans sp. PhB188 TaxID=2485200 RepID=UPI000F47D014|nr:agmatine deiminase family protein [Frondihabitans sp. PhB188]ROQ39644.1 agmatine deiminase [Frondihabitans sp. PhB188]
MGWRMPAETEPHDRTWMAFPREGLTLNDDPASAEEARAAWAAVAHATAEFEPVTVVVDPSALADARRHLSAAIDIVEAPLDDFWMRDIGPTFVVPAGAADLSPAPAPGLGAVDWIFNGWGAQVWAEWGSDREIARVVAELAGAEVIPSLLVNEGGAIHVDGAGTVLVTETVQLDPGRNPHADRARVEAELARTIGSTHVVWLPRGLTRDYEELGTRGHVDMVAAMPSPGRVLLHAQTDAGHPDHAVSAASREFLRGQTTASGTPFEVIDLPAPSGLRDDEGFVDHSYVNHLVVNGGVIACGFGDPAADDRAAGILAEEYPGRRVVTVDALPIFARGGGIHCITQQQPALP